MMAPLAELDVSGAKGCLIQIEGGQAIYSVSTENLIPGSSKAQKSEMRK